MSETPNYVKTVILIAGFGIWFLVIVVLLPIITEKDAMPGFNKILRRLLAWGNDGDDGLGKSEL
jgi:hypothetical protein